MDFSPPRRITRDRPATPGTEVKEDSKRVGERSRSQSPGKSPGKSRSPSRSASRSRSQDDKKKGDKGKGDYGVETIKLTDGDAAFILGKGGKTKHKIATVAGADIELFERDLTLEIRGSEKCPEWYSTTLVPVVGSGYQQILNG